MKIRINADDFGISSGVNKAVEEMFRAKKLHSTSLICGCNYFDEAVIIAKRNPLLDVGLHLNLSIGKSVLGNNKLPLLTNKDGTFKHGFVMLFLLTIFCRKKILNEITAEVLAQINLIQTSIDRPLSHIDGHRHIHFIPGIFNIVNIAAKKFSIKKIRVINEQISPKLLQKNHQFIFNGGLAKWLILRLFGLFNGSKNISQEYFFSIIYSCNISKDLISQIEIPPHFEDIEIMIHPGNPLVDKDINGIYEKSHLLSPMRQIENL